MAWLGGQCWLARRVGRDIVRPVCDPGRATEV